MDISGRRAVCLGVIIVAVLMFVTGFVIGRHQSTSAQCCPQPWVGFGDKCYYFSDVEGNWTWARQNCSEMGAVLAVIQSKSELAFVQRYKGVSDHWIGLSCPDPNQPWEWVDGTELDSSVFTVGGGECFAFLNNQKVTSARSGGERYWICTKPACA